MKIFRNVIIMIMMMMMIIIIIDIVVETVLTEINLNVEIKEQMKTYFNLSGQYLEQKIDFF
jgi:hypothetical protein